jgi:serine/threonine protein phosphatase PrpC
MTDGFHLAWRAFHTPKAGHTVDEYEDALAGDPEHGRFAIADGASESAFADVWAQILVNAYVETAGPWSGWLADARKRWRSKCQERELPWYTEAKFDEGAYAALLGIAFTDRRWVAAAVGDCSMFQIRDGRLIRAFPMRSSAEFDNRPSLLGSRNRRTDQPRARRVHLRGDLKSEDIILMMTDALAQWFLKQREEGRQPWKDLKVVTNEEAFVRLVSGLREAREMRNDDVTLVLIEPQKS